MVKDPKEWNIICIWSKKQTKKKGKQKQPKQTTPERNNLNQTKQAKKRAKNTNR